MVEAASAPCDQCCNYDFFPTFFPASCAIIKLTPLYYNQVNQVKPQKGLTGAFCFLQSIFAPEKVPRPGGSNSLKSTFVVSDEVYHFKQT